MAQKIAAVREAFAVGSFVRVPFGQTSQVAHVVGYARDGRLKIRAWNRAQDQWMPGTRLVPVCPRVKPTVAVGLPAPPALPGA